MKKKTNIMLLHFSFQYPLTLPWPLGEDKPAHLKAGNADVEPLQSQVSRALPAPQTHPCPASNTLLGLSTWPAWLSLQNCHPSATQSAAVLNMPECTAYCHCSFAISLAH